MALGADESGSGFALRLRPINTEISQAALIINTFHTSRTINENKKPFFGIMSFIRFPLLTRL